MILSSDSPGFHPFHTKPFIRRVRVDEEMFNRLKDAFIEMGNALGPVQEAMARFAYGLQISVKPKTTTKAQRRAKRRRLAAMKRDMTRSKHHCLPPQYQYIYDEVDAWRRWT